MSILNKILLAIIAVPILYVVIVLGIDTAKGLIARNEIANIRAQTEEVSDERISAAIDILNQSNIVSSKVASSKVDVCYVNYESTGFVADYWYQDCYIRYVSGFSTKLSSDEAKQRLADHPESEDYFGEDKESYNELGFYFSLKEDDSSMVLAYRPANVVGNDDCWPNCPRFQEAPNPIQGTFSVKGSVMLDEELSVREYKIFDPDDVGNLQNQVWIISDNHYYREKLGCGLDKLFCLEQPINRPMHPSI